MIARCLIGCFAALAWMSLPVAGTAQEFPTRNMTLVVPFAAGGGTDALGRIIAQRLSERFRNRVVVENKGGAGSMLGASAVAKSPPDGHSILLVTNSTIAVTPILHKTPLINPLRDFAPLSMVSGSPFFLAVSPKSSIQSVKDFIEYARQKPKQLSFSSAGVGSTAHISMELFMKMSRIELVHVPYTGSAQAINDVMAGHVDVTFTDPTVAIQIVKSGLTKLIGISTKARHPAAPDVPSISETALPEYDAVAWVAMVAPAQTPRPVLQKLHVELRDIVTSSEFRTHLLNNGSIVLDIATTEQIGEFFKSEVSTWGDILRGAGLAGSATSIGK